jgi:predicted porin
MLKPKLLSCLIAMSLPLTALADSGNVTVYGVANMSFDFVKTGSTTAVQGTTNNKISSNATRIGFKGAENLGDGLSAIWQIESAVAMDNAGGTLASRNSYAGLSSLSYGTLLLGRYDTPYKISARKLDNFSDSIGDNRSRFGSVSGTSASIAFDGREPDIISYTSQKMAGFSGAIAYANLNQSATTANTKANVLSLSGMYDDGTLYGTLAYESHTLDTVRIGGKETALRAGLDYKMNDFNFGMAYEKTDDTLGGAATPAACAALTQGANCLGHNAWYVTGKYSFGKNALKTAYTQVGNLGSKANSDAKQYSLGFEHHLSKRTMLFAVYTRLNNSTAANYALGNASFSTSAAASVGAGAHPSALSFGMRHAF